MTAGRLTVDTLDLATARHRLVAAATELHARELEALTRTSSPMVDAASADAVAYARGALAVLNMDVAALAEATGKAAQALAEADAALAVLTREQI